MRIALIAAVLMIFSAPVFAQDYKTILDIPEGATLVNLSANEQVEIEQDLLVATLRYEAEHANPSKVQDDINSMMKKALDKAKKLKDVKAATQQYSVYQYDRSRGKGARRDMVWKGQQGLQIKSRKADDLLKLTGELQEMGMAMNGLSYTVSPELLESTRDGLLEDALKKLTAKAERTAKALGKSSSDILQLNIDMGGYHPRPVMQMARSDMVMASMEAAPPVAAPGETTINLTVSAQALLK